MLLFNNAEYDSFFNPLCCKNKRIYYECILQLIEKSKSAFVADHGRTHRPYSTILIPVSDNVADLKNELLILKDSIRSIMRMIIKMTETNELGQFLIRDEMLENFFSDYFFIKKDGLIPGYIEEIEKMLRKIVKTEVYENMIKEYQSFYNADEISAREVVDGQLAEMQFMHKTNHSDYVSADEEVKKTQESLRNLQFVNNVVYLKAIEDYEKFVANAQSGRGGTLKDRARAERDVVEAGKNLRGGQAAYNAARTGDNHLPTS